MHFQGNIPTLQSIIAALPVTLKPGFPIADYIEQDVQAPLPDKAFLPMGIIRIIVSFTMVNRRMRTLYFDAMRIFDHTISPTSHATPAGDIELNLTHPNQAVKLLGRIRGLGTGNLQQTLHPCVWTGTSAI